MGICLAIEFGAYKTVPLHIDHTKGDQSTIQLILWIELKLLVTQEGH